MDNYTINILQKQNIKQRTFETRQLNIWGEVVDNPARFVWNNTETQYFG